MAAPNINLTTTVVNIDSLHFEATDAAATVTSSTVASNHARKIEAIFATNISATVATISVWHRKGGVDGPITVNERISLGQKINVLLGAPLYMAEGDSLKVQANADDAVHIVAPFVDMV